MTPMSKHEKKTAQCKLPMLKENIEELYLGFSFSEESQNEYTVVKPNYPCHHYETERCLSRSESFLESARDTEHLPLSKCENE